MPRLAAWYPNHRVHQTNEVIRVACVDSSGYKTTGAKGSNYGSTVDICAPAASTGTAFGGIAVCAYATGDTIEGLPQYPQSQIPHIFWFTEVATSGAAAEVSGVLALLRAMYPNKPSSFLKEELFRGAVPLPDPLWDSDITQSKLGHGMLNAYRSLTQWGHISENTTWSGDVYVSGDVLVDSAATLTLDSGTTVWVMPDDVNWAINPQVSPAGINDTLKCELWVKGTLDVNGTAAQPVTFKAWDPSGESSGTYDWFGIFVWENEGAGADFDHVVIKNALRGIQSRSFMRVKNTTIEKCAWQGISVAYADSVYIENTTIDGPELAGLVLGDATARLSNSTIKNVQDYGALVRDDGVSLCSRPTVHQTKREMTG